MSYKIGKIHKSPQQSNPLRASSIRFDSQSLLSCLSSCTEFDSAEHFA